MHPGPTIRASRRCIAASRPSPICAGSARRHLPRFAFEYCDGGAGADGGIARNWDALDAVELVPRYGVTHGLAAGRRRAVRPALRGADRHSRRWAGPSLVWPGADSYLAAGRAARARALYARPRRRHRPSSSAAELAPDVLWFQLYRCSRNDHAIGFDLVQRARGRRRACAGADASTCRCAPRARARSRSGIDLAVPAGPAHDRRHSDARPAI